MIWALLRKCFAQNSRRRFAVSEVEARGLALREVVEGLPKGRAREMALIHLTECAMWTELGLKEAGR